MYFFFFKQKTAYEMRISDWSSDVCSSDLRIVGYAQLQPGHGDHPAMAELAVDPEARGRGIGGRLVTEVLSEGGPDARVWAHGNLPAARSEERRVGKECGRTCRSRWEPDN